MMLKRDIKFRGKCLHSDAWVYGSLVCFDNDEAPEIQSFDPYQDGTYQWRSVNVDAETVGQYIGRRDCDGRQIYEGDIFTVNGRYPKLVKYIDEWHSFCVANLDAITDPCMSRWGDICNYQQPAPNWWNDFKREIKVVGNMYDNPEMVKVKEG